MLGRHWLGLEIPDDHLMPANRPVAFAMFTVAAFCYRWFILAAIIIFLTKMLKPYGLESIGIGIAMFSMIGLIGMPGYKLYKYMSVPGRLHQVKKPRFFSILSILLLVCRLDFVCATAALPALRTGGDAAGHRYDLDPATWQTGVLRSQTGRTNQCRSSRCAIEQH